MRNRHYAIMWNCYGLEAVAEIPDPAEHTFAILKDQRPPETPNLNMWRLRAQFNTQRHYEIYIVTATPDIDRDAIRDMFEADPQTAADTIRRLGQCFYNNRRSESQAVQIT
jgi:hypothetical protein